MKPEFNKTKLRNKLWRQFSLFIRLRDYGLPCISCNTPVSWGHNWHAGHYWPAGNNYNSIRFDEKNVNGQCGYCNTFLEGNRQGYREGLIKKYGKGVLLELDVKRTLKNHWTVFEFLTLTAHYKQLNDKKLKGDS